MVIRQSLRLMRLSSFKRYFILILQPRRFVRSKFLVRINKLHNSIKNLIETCKYNMQISKAF